jgi:hypothetical protein
MKLFTLLFKILISVITPVNLLLFLSICGFYRAAPYSGTTSLVLLFISSIYLCCSIVCMQIEASTKKLKNSIKQTALNTKIKGQ